jgi:hypothetical protein
MRQRYPQRERAVGVGLVLLGVAIAGLFVRGWKRDTYVPLDVPFRVTEGYSGRWQFMPRGTGDHEVVLEAEYPDTNQETAEAIERALGVTYREATAQDSAGESEVDVSWELWERRERRAEGRAAGRNSGYVMRSGAGRELTWAELKAGHQYELRAHVNKSGPMLLRSSTRIKVDRHPATYEWVGFLLIPTGILVLGLILIGAFVLWNSSGGRTLRP